MTSALSLSHHGQPERVLGRLGTVAQSFHLQAQAGVLGCEKRQEVW